MVGDIARCDRAQLYVGADRLCGDVPRAWFDHQGVVSVADGIGKVLWLYARSYSPERTFFCCALYLPLGRWLLRTILPSTQPSLPRIRKTRWPSWKWERPPIGTSAETLLRSRQTLRQSVPPSRTGLNWRRVCRPFTLETRRNGTRIFSSKALDTLKEGRVHARRGTAMAHLKQNVKTTDSFSGELAGDFMFWPTGRHRFGWYLEPAYDYSFAGGHQQSIGMSAGLLIGIR
jgi:hypothetical protein